MFDTDNDLLEWCRAARLDDEAVQIIRRIRESEPARVTRSRSKNVRGRYPSRKMGRTIQFETHRNMLAFILEMEHDPDVIEYWDYPPQIKLTYATKVGSNRGIIHGPHFFVIRSGSAGWVECNAEENLMKLAASQPERYRRDDNGNWSCPPGEDYGFPYRLDYTVRSTAEIDWVFQRNVLFLEDYLRADDLELPVEVTTYVHSLVAARPGMPLAALLKVMEKHALPSDIVYKMLVTDLLYVDLSSCALAQPDKAFLFYSRDAALLYGADSNPPTRPTRPILSLLPGKQIQWDGKSLEVLNRGEKYTWLRDTSGTVIKLNNLALEKLIEQDAIEQANDDSDESGSEFQGVIERLATATKAELAEANRRYALLMEFESTGQVQTSRVSLRTLFYWKSQRRAAEQRFGSGFLGLLPGIHLRGNRNPKLPEETIKLMDEHISAMYEDLNQPTRYAVWSQLTLTCKEQGVIAPSYPSFCLRVRNRPTHQVESKRRGRRGAYSTEPLYLELNRTTPIHGDRPFEIGHVDHTELDVERNSPRRKTMSRGLGILSSPGLEPETRLSTQMGLSVRTPAHKDGESPSVAVSEKEMRRGSRWREKWRTSHGHRRILDASRRSGEMTRHIRSEYGNLGALEFNEGSRLTHRRTRMKFQIVRCRQFDYSAGQSRPLKSS